MGSYVEVFADVFGLRFCDCTEDNRAFGREREREREDKERWLREREKRETERGTESFNTHTQPQSLFLYHTLFLSHTPFLSLTHTPGSGFSRCPLTSLASFTECFLLHTTKRISGSNLLLTHAALRPITSLVRHWFNCVWRWERERDEEGEREVEKGEKERERERERERG